MSMIKYSGVIIKIDERMGKIKPYTLVYLEQGMFKNNRYVVVPNQIDEMCAELAGLKLNHGGVPFLSRTAANLRWYDNT